jgi:murein L,D-transpeptidase YcbB/YkuD
VGCPARRVCTQVKSGDAPLDRPALDQRVGEDTRKALIERTTLPAGRSVLVGEVSELQSMLAALGLYKGALDGVESPALREAIRRFQQANGLPPDGLAGPQTYTRIKNEFEAQGKPAPEP